MEREREREDADGGGDDGSNLANGNIVAVCEEGMASRLKGCCFFFPT